MTDTMVAMGRRTMEVPVAAQPGVTIQSMFPWTASSSGQAEPLGHMVTISAEDARTAAAVVAYSVDVLRIDSPFDDPAFD